MTEGDAIAIGFEENITGVTKTEEICEKPFVQPGIEGEYVRIPPDNATQDVAVLTSSSMLAHYIGPDKDDISTGWNMSMTSHQIISPPLTTTNDFISLHTHEKSNEIIRDSSSFC